MWHKNFAMSKPFLIFANEDNELEIFIGKISF